MENLIYLVAVVNNELTEVEAATQNAANSALASKMSVSKVIENTSHIVNKIHLDKNIIINNGIIINLHWFNKADCMLFLICSSSHGNID